MIEVGSPRDEPTSIMLDEQTTLDVTSARNTLGMFYVGAGSLLHLLANTNFDPWFGVTLGYLQTRERLVVQASNAAIAAKVDHLQVTHRGAIGLQLGIGFRILKRFTIGPRFDFLVPFAGKTCGSDGTAAATCILLKDDEKLGFDPSEYFPRPWSVGLQAGFVL